MHTYFVENKKALSFSQTAQSRCIQYNILTVILIVFITILLEASLLYFDKLSMTLVILSSLNSLVSSIISS